MVAALTLVGCGPKPSPELTGIQPGTSYATMRGELAHLTPFARSCDGRTYFPDYEKFEECRSRSQFIETYRDDRWHYAFTITDGKVSGVSISDHTLPWP